MNSRVSKNNANTAYFTPMGVLATAAFLLHVPSAMAQTLMIGPHFRAPKDSNLKSSSYALTNDNAQELNQSDDFLKSLQELSADSIFKKIAPDGLTTEPSSCAPTPSNQSISGSTVLFHFEIQCSGFRINQAGMVLHNRLGRTVGVTLNGIPNNVQAREFSYKDFAPINVVAAPYLDSMIRSDRVLVPDINTPGQPSLVPAWLIVWRDHAAGMRYRSLIEAGNGIVIAQEPLGTHLQTVAKVFPRSPIDINTVQVTLKDLVGPTLRGRNFGIYYGEVDTNTPPEAGPEGFVADPWQPQEAANFDQIQSYYGAMRALDWFRDKFAYDPGSTVIPIKLNQIIDRSPNNAAYFGVSEGGPEILIGPGDGTNLTNLGRDVDVVTHEFAHHIIARRLTNTRGESGVIHEGTADYFTFALNNDPAIGRSIKPGAIALRQAAMGPDDRIDNPDYPAGKHSSGQIWAGMLWGIRNQIGAEAADKIVFSSIDYYTPSADFGEAIVALMLADRDHHPLPKADPSYGVFGQYKCQILHHAVLRGFAQLIENVDPSGCDLDLSQAAAQSRSYTESKLANKRQRGRKIGFEFAGVKCGAVAPHNDFRKTSSNLDTTNAPTTGANLALILLMMIPLVSAIGCVKPKKSPARRS